MARIRTIKPEFWEDERLGRLSLLSRFTFAGLISLADDEGRGRGSAKYLWSRLHAYARDVSLDQMEVALQELQTAGRVVLYEIGGDSFYWLPKFNDHQRIDKPTASRLPAPPVSPGPLVDSSRTPHGMLLEPSHTDWKGMEGRGMERSVTEVERSGMDHPAGSPSATAPGDPPEEETTRSGARPGPASMEKTGEPEPRKPNRHRGPLEPFEPRPDLEQRRQSQKAAIAPAVAAEVEDL